MLFVLGSVVIFVPYFYTHASFLHSSVTPMKLPHFPRVRPFPGVVAWAWHLIHFDPPSPLYTCTSYFTTCNLSRCLGLWGCSCQVIIDVLVLVVRACSRCRCLNSSPPPSNQSIDHYLHLHLHLTLCLHLRYHYHRHYHGPVCPFLNVQFHNSGPATTTSYSYMTIVFCSLPCYPSPHLHLHKTSPLSCRVS